MHLGVIGYGAIGQELLALLAPLGIARTTLLVRPGREAAVRQALGAGAGGQGVQVTADPAALLDCTLVAEVAGHAAVAAHGERLLAAGRDLLVVSVGALADAALHDRLVAAARASGARLILPSGAVGGIDILAALAPAGDMALRYTGTKPPQAWKGTPAEEVCDLDSLTAPHVFFEGSARQAALAYPKNANVAATLALAGPGFDGLTVRLVADPDAPGNAHRYDLVSPLATVGVDIANRASGDNAKTSLATVYSVFREIRNQLGPVAI
ncbi:aspartate dehydrogenase [Pseudooceanicola sp. 200-1SW]|uniref:aspartate dehydrogenase n=1 Tax=Pseudooceanicola sp. 200-1SW TaxID=3425949 RepID=UPI003D7FAFC6